MNIPHFLAALPVVICLGTLIWVIAQFRKINTHHQRFKAADEDCRKAIEMMRRSKNEQQFVLRKQRVQECLEMMEAIMKER